MLEVVVNGEIRQTIPLQRREGGSTVLFDGDISQAMPAGADGWVVLTVRGDQPHGIWARGRPSFAVTNPIFIDGTGDGDWTMGR